MKPLEGVIVLDFTQRHGASVSTMMLADFGARVIKVERPESPDPVRNWAPQQNGSSVYFTYLNRGKDSICIDYTTVQGRQVIFELIKKADIVVENLPVGHMAALGLGYEDACKINDNIIYASMSSFGQTGPRSNKKADDLVVQAMAGMMDRTGFADGPATPVGCRVSNHISSVYLMMGINMALIHKEKTGEGQYLDISEMDCLFAMMETGPWVYSISDRVLPRTGNSYPSISPYDTLRAKNGYISVGVSTDAQWQKFCAALGVTDLAENELYMTNESRGDNYETGLKQALEAVTMKEDKFVLEAKLREAKLACAAVYTVPEAMASEHIAVREMMVSVDDEGAGHVRIPGTTIKLMKTPGGIEKGAPVLGKNTHEVLEYVGYSPEQIKGLAEAEITFQSQPVSK